MRSLSDVSIHSCLILKNGNEIELYLFSSCDNLSSFQGYLTIIIQVVVACQLNFSANSFGTMLILFFLNIGMLTMRMYTLYERSRKVLAFCIVIVVVTVAVACVSLNLRENQYLV